jgi:hypothetical protein
MALTPEVIQIVIQGGAVGLLLMFGVMGYNLARLAINKVSTFINNHLEHNTEAVKEGTEVMREVVSEIKIMSERLGRRDD